MGTRTCAALIAATCALALTAAVSPGAQVALGATPLPKPSSGSLWSTIDVCNTAAHPNTVGIRGSMPGTADAHELMYMSFRLEYRTAGGSWRYLGGAGRTSFALVGNGASVARQAGQNFEIAPPVPQRVRASRTYVLRGVAVFEWRLHGHAIATAVRATRAGHVAAAGADPPGFSAATCTIHPNRRGSLVITPVTPSASSRAISARSSTVHA